jgi:uncharacterized protein YoxC
MFDTVLDINIEDIHSIHRKLDKIMSALDDLNTAVSALTVSVGNEITALNTALANSDAAGIETAVANLNTLNTQLQTSIAPTQTVTPATTA